MEIAPTPEPSKLKKAWKWTADHAEEIAITAFGVGITALYATAVVYSAKEQNAAIKEYNEFVDRNNTWLMETQNAGKDVYRLDNANYLVLDKDVPRELHDIK